MDEAFVGIQGIRKIVDDIVAFDKDEQQHVEHVREILRHCEDTEISLNCNFASPTGLTLTSEGYSISNDIIDAISNFPTPSNTDLCSFMGLTSQLMTCTKELAPVLAPLRPLLSTHNDFLWTPAHDIAFQQAKQLAKQLLTTAPVLTYFDPSKENCLHTDASTLGLGFLLLQKPTNSNSDWRVVQAGSRFLTVAESRYTVIELECLAVGWAMKKCHLFLAGLGHFTIVTDYNPPLSHSQLPSLGQP